MPDTSPATLDPVSFEVLNHRLLSISEEMGIHYMRCSGSNVLITGNDAASAIMDADGNLVAVGPYIVPPRKPTKKEIELMAISLIELIKKLYFCQLLQIELGNHF